MNSEQMIKQDEGFSLTPYKCSAGVLTVGWGHNLEDDRAGIDDTSKPITIEKAEELFTQDMRKVRNDLSKFPFALVYSNVNVARKAVLENMMFNLGFNRLAQFKRFLQALEGKNYNLAADEMLSSKWAEQVRLRAHRLAKIMRSGVIDV